MSLCPNCGVGLSGWFCPKCKIMIPFSVNTCSKCGQGRSLIFNCVKCKKQLFWDGEKMVLYQPISGDGMSACPNCNTILTGWICSKCKLTMPFSINACSKCGEESTLGVVTCPNCKKQSFWDEGKLVLYQPISDISLNAPDDILKKEIIHSLINLRLHEAGTGWAKFSLILKGSMGEMMMAQMLKAIVDQNKIIIRQNELLLRAIKRDGEDSRT